MKIDGEFLSNLRFADDIFLCTETPQELQHMLQELSDESRRMGLKMNIAKTNVMVVDITPINMNNVLIENVQGYVYLGQHYSLKENNQDKEIQRRIMAGWAAYVKHRDIFKSNLAICLTTQVYNSCVLPAMTYGAESWARIHESVITYDGHISRPGITELELGPSENSYSRARKRSVIVVLEVGGFHTGCLVTKRCTAHGRRVICPARQSSGE